MTVNTITDSEMISTFETHKPEKLRDFFKPYGDQGASNYLMFRELGYEKSVALDKFSHYELDEYESKFKARSNVDDPGAGAALEVVIHADNVDAQNRFYPQRFDA